MEIKEFIVQIEETLIRQVKINSNSSENAYRIAKNLYQDEKILLNDSDFFAVNFFVDPSTRVEVE